MNWSRPSAARSPRRRRWIPRSTAATGCCGSSSVPIRTGNASDLMQSLPSFSNFETFQAWRADASQCLPAALDIARSHGLPHADPQVFSTGTNLVVGLDARLILKIFPPLLRSQFVSERMTLAQLRGHLGVPIPEIALEGGRD